MRLHLATTVAVFTLMHSASAETPAPPPPCAFGVDLLWHSDSEPGHHKMGVSVTSANGQQIPGLTPEQFTVEHQGVSVDHNAGLRVAQSRNAHVGIVADPAQNAATLADPIAYDVYFAVDLTASMATPLKDNQGREASRQSWLLKVVDLLVRPNKQGNYALFDQGDRVYIVGFTQDLQSSFLSGATANRETITRALVALNEFQPTGGPAALYKAMLHNLALVQNQAAQYSDPAQKRQAVLITLTDSWNGTDPQTGKVLKACTDNDPFTDQVRDAILKTRDATSGNLKVFVLGLGKVGAIGEYSLDGPAGKGCRIAETEAHVLDGRALGAIGDPQLGSGGFYPSEDPSSLVRGIAAQFEALKTAYELSYDVPANLKTPGAYKVSVRIGETTCSDSELQRTSFVHHAQQSEPAETSAQEIALTLASALLLFFFAPRALENLGVSGGASAAPAPKKAKTKKRSTPTR